MRDPTLNTRAATEAYYIRGICFERTKQWAKAKRARDAIKEAAIDEACCHLARIALDIISWTDGDADTPDPKQERRHAIAQIEIAIENLPETPDNLPALALLRQAIPTLERLQPKIPRGHSANLWRERNQLIVETRKLICQKYGFKKGRNPATSDKECGNSIISQALKKLETQLGWFEKFGAKKPDIALAESSINEICRTWKIGPPD
jgi:hypothetical protein